MFLVFSSHFFLESVFHSPALSLCKIYSSSVGPLNVLSHSLTVVLNLFWITDLLENLLKSMGPFHRKYLCMHFFANISKKLIQKPPKWRGPILHMLFQDNHFHDFNPLSTDYFRSIALAYILLLNSKPMSLTVFFYFSLDRIHRHQI